MPAGHPPEPGPEAQPYDAVVVVSFGGPEGPDDVLPFLENVTRGRGVPAERLAAVAEHYLARGGVSPINQLCRDLVDSVRDELHAYGHDLPVYWGNRNWHPMLADTVATMRDDGVRRALAFVTSAYSSWSSCRQYLDDIARARAQVGDGAPAIDKLRPFHDHPGFVEPMADGLRVALDELGPDAAIVFTAHSIPVAAAETCAYEDQLRETAGLVADRAAPGRRWALAWQSRSGPPTVPWLAPDINDHLRLVSDDGASGVAVVPVGFVADHMEIVHDLDTEAAATARDLGLRMLRTPTAGTDPRFVAMIRELVEERLDPTRERRCLGRRGPAPDHCPAGCCPPARPAGIHVPRTPSP